jgi:pimeloyl-ACP methyl ester carboxylesterase
MPEDYKRVITKLLVKEGFVSTYTLNRNETPVVEKRDFVTINQSACLGCGKFLKVCSLGVIEFVDHKPVPQTELNIPIYFFHGIYDYTVSYDLAKDFYNMIKAPVKGFYTFEKSAHSPMFEEPELFREILEKEVLRSTIKLTD